MSNKSAPAKVLSKAGMALIAAGILNLVLWSPAGAAEFIVGGPEQSIAVGDEVELSVGIDTAAERLNAFQLSLVVPEGLELVSLGHDDSAISIWIQAPLYDAERRTIFLSGGVPGGAAGKFVLVRAKVKPTRRGTFTLAVSSSAEAYINDGLGTKAEVSIREFAFNAERAAVSRKLGVPAVIIAVLALMSILVWRAIYRRKADLDPPSAI